MQGMAPSQPDLLQPASHTISNEELLRSTSPSGRGRAKSQTIRLIRDISPSAAQLAFHTGSLALGGDDDNHVALDLSVCTAAEKDLGLRVARAAQQLRAWCTELGQWPWKGSFDDEEPGSDMDEDVVNGDKSLEQVEAELNAFAADADKETASFTSDIRARERRLDEISHDLEQLEYDELKDHVLSLHHGMSRPGSSYSDVREANLSMMDDYTILVTHILMQSLPNLFLLRQHLETWTLRLAVLELSSTFLRCLSQAQRAMRLARQILDFPHRANESGLDLSRYSAAVANVKKALSKKCQYLGQTLDSMLDKLEGQQDKLPDRWIDEFETFESEFSGWTVKAQQSVMELAMQAERERRAVEQQSTLDPDASSQPRGHDVSSNLPQAASTSNPHEGLHADHNRHDDADDDSQADETVQIAHVALREQVGTVMMRRASLTSVRSISSNDVRRISIVRSPGGSGMTTPLRVRSSIDETRSPTYPGNLAERASEELIRQHGHRIIRTSVSSVPALAPSHEETVDEDMDSQRNLTTRSSSNVLQPAMEASTKIGPLTTITTSTVPAATVPPQTPRGSLEWRHNQDPKTPGSVASPVDGLASPQESPSKRAGWRPQHGVLNAVMSKRRNRYKEALKSPQKSPKKTGARSSETQLITQDMELQISNILTTLPTPIKLESRRGVPGGMNSTTTSRSTSGPQRPGRSRAPSLTLARATTPLPLTDGDKPASTTRRVRKSAGAEDPEIQLYHLSSSKGLAPTKLYIRRVGESGERLMVRVGGGWADLADYLLQYAEHHGRRAVSGSNDAVQVLDMQSSVPAGTSTPGPTSNIDGVGSANVSRRNSPSAKMLLEGFAPTPTNSTSANLPNESTPGSVGSNGLRRSLGPGEGSASLAGPRVKKFDPSGETQEWIDGMVEKAKKANANDANKIRKGDEFADIGKVGGTKRLFMKGQ